MTRRCRQPLNAKDFLRYKIRFYNNIAGHHNFACNHIRIAHNKKVQEAVLDFLK